MKKFLRLILIISILLLIFFSPIRQDVQAAETSSNRIGVRSGPAQYGEFYDIVTGDSFIPQGNNYLHLDGINGYHAMFDPGSYNSSRVELTLNRMAYDGYNIIRVFLDYRKIGGTLISPGVDPAYMANLVDFLHRARTHNIYVIISTEWIPANYYSIVHSYPLTPNCEGGGVNTIFMSRGHIEAYKVYLTDVVVAIKNADVSLLNTVFAYELWNEGRFEANVVPFSLTSGYVTPAEGGTYNMADSADRQLMADNSAIFWANQMSAAIKAVDSNVLTTISLFTPKGVGRDGYDGVKPADPLHPDNRAPMRPRALEKSAIDYIDIHQYPLGSDYNIAQDLDSAEIGLLGREKPRLMGEFGAIKNIYPDLIKAAYMLRSHQVNACSFGFLGSLLWNWDTTEQTAYWTALDGGGMINNLLSPIGNPNQCVPLTSSVGVVKTADKIQVGKNETITYTLNYINLVSESVTIFILEDLIPEGTSYIENSATADGICTTTKCTWNLGTLAPGISGSVQFKVRVE